jgi:hypothetical protein
MRVKKVDARYGCACYMENRSTPGSSHGRLICMAFKAFTINCMGVPIACTWMKNNYTVDGGMD